MPANIPLRTIALVIVDVILGFLIICVLPFAWILKDGLGPNSVQSSGLTSVWNTLMTFYVGPLILLFFSIDLLIRRFITDQTVPSKRGTILLGLAILLGIGALSMIGAALLFD